MPQSDFEDSEVVTKNEAVINGSLVDYVWSVADSVGIFPDTGSQIYFSMAAGAGQKTAAFDGGGWALKKNSAYYSYFPFYGDIYINKTAVPLTYVGQKQVGNGVENRADIGRYCYMVAKGVADEATGSLYFNYERLGILFRVKVPVKPGTYKTLTLCTNEDLLVQKGTYDAMALDLDVHNPVYGRTITLDLEDVTFDEEGTLVAYFMLAPFDYENRPVTFELVDSEGNVAVSSVRGKNYVRGMTYGNAPHFSISPANVNVEGASGSFVFDITASAAHGYTVATDASWLTLASTPKAGDASVTVYVGKNSTDKVRKGHVIVSETVNNVVLKNLITVTQEPGDGGLGSGQNDPFVEDDEWKDYIEW